MKRVIAVFIIMMSQIGMAATDFGPRLHCREISCRDIEKPVNAGSWCSNNRNLPARSLKVADFSRFVHPDLLSVDLGDGGDQYAIFSFDAQELEALKPGQTINGQYVDAFSWSDGDHTRYIVEVSCEL